MWLLALVSLIWAFSFGLTQGKLAGVDSSLVSALRLGLAGLVFLPFVRRGRETQGQLVRWIGLGALQFGAMYLALIESYRFLPSHVVALLTCVTPIWVLIFAAPTEGSIRRSAWVAAGLSVLAGAILSYRTESPALTWRGVALVQLSNLCFAAGQVAYRRMAATSSLTPAQHFGWMYGGAFLITASVAGVRVDWAHVALTSTQVYTLLYLGILASGLCFFAWNRGATQVSSGLLAVMNNAKVPLAVLCSLLVFHEPVDLPRLLLAALVLALALWLVRR